MPLRSSLLTPPFLLSFQDATFQRFNFRLSVKADHYNDEARNRVTVRAVSKLDFGDYTKRMVKELREAGMEVPEQFAK